MWRGAGRKLLRVGDFARGRLEGFRRHLPYYISEGANWVIRSEGEYITREIMGQYGVECRLLTDAGFLYRQVVHFGSQNLFTGGGYRRVHSSNQVVVTFFHGDANDPAFTPAVAILQNQIEQVSRVIVSCSLMAER